MAKIPLRINFDHYEKFVSDNYPNGQCYTCGVVLYDDEVFLCEYCEELYMIVGEST